MLDLAIFERDLGGIRRPLPQFLFDAGDPVPGLSVGTAKALIPRLPSLGSVTAKTIASWELTPEVTNCLVPLRTQPRSLRRARVRIAAASEPGMWLGQAERSQQLTARYALEPAFLLCSDP